MATSFFYIYIFLLLRHENAEVRIKALKEICPCRVSHFSSPYDPHHYHHNHCNRNHHHCNHSQNHHHHNFLFYHQLSDHQTPINNKTLAMSASMTIITIILMRREWLRCKTTKMLLFADRWTVVPGWSWWFWLWWFWPVGDFHYFDYCGDEEVEDCDPDPP